MEPRDVSARSQSTHHTISRNASDNPIGEKCNKQHRARLDKQQVHGRQSRAGALPLWVELHLVDHRQIEPTCKGLPDAPALYAQRPVACCLSRGMLREHPAIRRRRANARAATHTPSPTETDGHPAHARTIRCSANNSAHRQTDQLERIEGGQYIYSDKPNKQPHRHTRKNRHPTRHPIKTIPRAPAHPALGAVKVRRDVCDKERECDPRERDEQGRDEHREEKLPGAAGAPTWSDKHRGSMAFMAQIQTNKQLSRGPLQISNKVRLNRNGSLLRARENVHSHTRTQPRRARAAAPLTTRTELSTHFGSGVPFVPRIAALCSQNQRIRAATASNPK